MVEALNGFVVGTVCCIVFAGVLINSIQEKKLEEKRTEVHQGYDPGIAVGHYCRDCKHRHESQHIPCDKLIKVNCMHFEWKEEQDEAR